MAEFCPERMEVLLGASGSSSCRAGSARREVDHLGERAAAFERVLEDFVADFELLLQDGLIGGGARVHDDNQSLGGGLLSVDLQFEGELTGRDPRSARDAALAIIGVIALGYAG